jgi:hypothetical protein
MALVNPNIAMSYKPTTEYQPRNALAEYAQIQQIQGGQRQAEMANMEIQEYKRKRDALSKIQSAIVSNGGPPDLRAAATEMMKNPEYLVQGRQLLQDVEDTAKLEQYIAGQAGGKPSAANALAPNVPATPMMPGALGSGTFDIAPPPAANALAPTAAPVANALAPAAPMDEVTKLEADIARLSGNTNPRAIAIVKNLEKRLEQMQPKVVGNSVYIPAERRFVTASGEKQPPAVQEFLFAQTPEGGNYQGSYQQFLADKSAAGRAPSRVGGGGGGGREPAVAPAVKPMTELQQRKADKERVDELQGVKAAKSTADELEKLTDELAGNPAKNKPPHPGYEKIIGIQASIPSLPGGDAKRAEQKLETFKGKIATFGRQLATQYGKLGNMAVQEWKIVADSIQNINPAAGNLDEQMRDVVRLARDFEKSMQERYDALPGNNSQQPATPATTGNLSPAEQAELDQLRKKFGK